jgi:ketosteroid isomerase-like protein
MAYGPAVRRPLTVRPRRRLNRVERLALELPRVSATGYRLLLLLPPTSRIRRAFLWRAVRLSYEMFNATQRVNPYVVAPDAVMIQPGAGVGGGGVFHGREEVVRGTQELPEVFDDFHIDPEELIDLGHQIVVFVQLRGHAHASGIPLDEPMTHVSTIRAGRIERFEVFEDRAEALRTVGLR